jgi:hypothetical protein
MNQSISHRGGRNSVTSHDIGLCAVSPAWLRKSVGSPVARIVVTIVEGLDGGHIPESRVKLAHLVLAIRAHLILNRCPERVE